MHLIQPVQCDYDLLHYLVELPFGVSTPSAIASGIEVWTWLIAENPDIEIALMSEMLSAWFDTITQRKGIFSQALKYALLLVENHTISKRHVYSYDDPFYHPVDYSPTDKEDIDRATSHARRLLSAHGMVLTMLFSRLQAARYRRPDVMFVIQRLVFRSARAHKALRWAHVVFGLPNRPWIRLQYTSVGSGSSLLIPTVRLWDSQKLPLGCLLWECSTWESLWNRVLLVCCTAAVSKINSLNEVVTDTCARWTYGANRVQVDADVRVLSEFLSYLQTDSVRGGASISSLSPVQSNARVACMYFEFVCLECICWFVPADISRLKSLGYPLRLLVENEIFRLAVWANPSNEAKRGADPVTGERNMVEVSPRLTLHQFWFTDFTHQTSWSSIVRTVWKIDPAIAIYATERFKTAGLHTQLEKLVRSNTLDVLDTPEALRFLVGEKLDSNVRRDLKVCVHSWTLIINLTKYFEASTFVGTRPACACSYILWTALQ